MIQVGTRVLVPASRDDGEDDAFGTVKAVFDYGRVAHVVLDGYQILEAWDTDSLEEL